MMRKLVLSVALAFTAGLVAGCPPTANNPGSGSSPATGDEILVGEYGSFTGSEATFGQSTHNGIMLAVEEQNAAGGIKGKKIKLIHYDDKGQSQEAGNCVTRLITNDKVVAVLGEVASSLSLAGAPVCQNKSVPMITPSSTNPAVTQVGDMIFRVCFLDDFQGWVMAKFAAEGLKAKKGATIYDQGSAYSKGLKDYIKKAFTDLGGQIVSEQAYDSGAQDFSAQLQSIKDSGAEVIFLPGYYTDAGNVSVQARKKGITVPFVGGDGWDSKQLAEIGGKAIEGSFYANHYTTEEQRPEVQNFVKKFQEKHKELPDGLAALGYDAAKLLFDAMGRAAALDGKTLAKAIADTKDFKGVTGAITIDPNRDAKKSAVIVQMKDGKPTAYGNRYDPPK